MARRFRRNGFALGGLRRGGTVPSLGRRPRLELLEDRRLLAITVTTELDVVNTTDGLTSLREAIATANMTPGPDDIDFTPSLSGKTIALSVMGGEFLVTDAVMIDATSLAAGLTIDAVKRSRIFRIDNGTAAQIPVTLRGLKLTNGDVKGHGGAIHSIEDLTVDHCQIVGNATADAREISPSFNGPVVTGGHGGGIFSNGSLTVLSSTLSGNVTGAGGEFNYGIESPQGTDGGAGGAIYSVGVTHIADSMISDNKTGGGAAGPFIGGTGGHGGGVISSGVLTIIDSTLTRNEAGAGLDGTGGSRGGSGGGVFSPSGFVIIQRSVISGNKAGAGGGTPAAFTPSTSYGGGGGGVATASGSLSIFESQVVDNASGAGGSGERPGRGGHGGGVSALEVTIVRSTIAGNSTGRGGNAPASSFGMTPLHGAAGGNGGGISTTLLTVFSSMILNNWTGVGGSGAETSGGGPGSNGGAGGSGGGIWGNGEVFVEGSAIYGNTTGAGGAGASGGAAGVDGAGGGLWFQQSSSRSFFVGNSTFSGNKAAGDGGGLLIRSATSSEFDAVLAHVTVTGNVADNNLNGSGRGGGATLFRPGEPNLSVMNSIVAGNDDAGLSPDVFVASGLPELSHSLVGDGTGTGTYADGGGNLIGSAGSPIDPLLAPLDDNGGPTLTHALLAGSPAIDAGDPTVIAPSFDQRGFAFSRIVGGRIDMGAFEAGAVSANFDGDEDVDGHDFLRWQRGVGTEAPDALNFDGDADLDRDIDGADLAVWRSQYGAGGASVVSSEAAAAVTSPYEAASPANATRGGPALMPGVVDALMAYSRWLADASAPRRASALRSRRPR